MTKQEFEIIAKAKAIRGQLRLWEFFFFYSFYIYGLKKSYVINHASIKVLTSGLINPLGTYSS